MKYKILPLFLPNNGCPHKCIFCDQKVITGLQTRISIKKIREQIEVFASSPAKKGLPRVRKEVAFYGGSFTCLPRDLQKSLLTPAYQALAKGDIEGIRLSTRPDYCDPQAIELLKGYEVQTVELGVQSMDPEVLILSGRGHGPEESIHALKRLKSEGFTTGVQLMPGLPGEDLGSFFSTIRQVISLKPDFVRLYPAIVLKGTGLEKLYSEGGYKPLSIPQAVYLCSQGVKLLRASGIRVIRCGIQPTPSLEKKGSICAGPFHPAFGELVESALLFELVDKAIKRFSASVKAKPPISIESPPGLFSRLKGQRGENVLKLREAYPDLKILLAPDPLIKGNLIKVKDKTGICSEIPVPDI